MGCAFGRWGKCNLGLVAMVCVFATIAAPAVAAPADPAAQLPESFSAAARFAQQADAALKSGNVNLAIIELKNAVQLSPRDGEIRARLGMALMRAGDAPGAERELRQARNDYGPP